MPTLQQAGHPWPNPLHHLRREPPAVQQAQRRQAEGRGQCDASRGRIGHVTAQAGTFKERNFESTFLIALRPPKRPKGKSTRQANGKQPRRRNNTAAPSTPAPELPLHSSDRLAHGSAAEQNGQESRPAPKKISSEAHKKKQREKKRRSEPSEKHSACAATAANRGSKISPGVRTAC